MVRHLTTFVYFEFVTLLVNVDTLVDCAYMVIDDLHQQPSVLAQPQPLHRPYIDIPVKLQLFLTCLLLDHTEVEVEAHLAVATLLSVLMPLQLHHLKVIQL